MCQDCNTTNFIFAVFVVSLSLTPSVKCSVLYINYMVGLLNDKLNATQQFGKTKKVKVKWFGSFLKRRAYLTVLRGRLNIEWLLQTYRHDAWRNGCASGDLWRVWTHQIRLQLHTFRGTSKRPAKQPSPLGLMSKFSILIWTACSILLILGLQLIFLNSNPTYRPRLKSKLVVLHEKWTRLKSSLFIIDACFDCNGTRGNVALRKRKSKIQDGRC